MTSYHEITCFQWPSKPGPSISPIRDHYKETCANQSYFNCWLHDLVFSIHSYLMSKYFMYSNLMATGQWLINKPWLHFQLIFKIFPGMTEFVIMYHWIPPNESMVSETIWWKVPESLNGITSSEIGEFNRPG